MRQLDPQRDAHRPTDSAALRAEAVRLTASGLTPADIAVAFALTPAAVEELLTTRMAA